MKILNPFYMRPCLLACSTSRRLASMQAFAYGFGPLRLLKGVAGGLLGRSAIQGGFATAALGLAMHFTMALTVTTIFYALSRRLHCPKSFGESWLWDCSMSVGFLRSTTFATATVPVMGSQSLPAHANLIQATNGWWQLIIHLFCVGLPIALVMHRYAPAIVRINR